MADDELRIENGGVYINGIKQSEAYTKTLTEEKGIKTPLVVPEGTVFVMGDNRDVSMDSRTYGPVPLDQIEGKVFLRIAPIAVFGDPE